MIDPLTLWLVAAAMAVAATLYASVGHAGASAYLAIMGLAAFAPETMRPTALTLNIPVAALGTWRYARARLVDWPMFALFAVGAVPAAWLAGGYAIDAELYRRLLGVILLLSAARLLWPAPIRAMGAVRAPPVPVALAAGVAIGGLSGLVGVGGGIFLSPLVLFLGWLGPRAASGTVAPFVLTVSMAGLAGNWQSVGALPPAIPVLAAAVLAGGILGSWLGARGYSPRAILMALAAVEGIAGLKLLGL